MFMPMIKHSIEFLITRFHLQLCQISLKTIHIEFLLAEVNSKINSEEK